MSHVVWTLDEAKKAMGDRDTFWLSDCACRQDRGGKCAKGMRVCLGFSEQATSSQSNRGQVGRKEVEELLQFAKTEKLVPRPFLDDNGTMIALCLCCPCCCDYILGKPGLENIAGPSIEATDMDACVSCGECVPACYFGARKLDDDGALKIDRSKCYGCGLCVDTCAPAAIKMVKKNPDPGK